MTTINVHFDGKVLVPDEPIDLPIGSAFVAKLESIVPAERASRASECPISAEQAAANPLLRLARLAYEFPDDPDAPTDGAAQVDHYLYGSPKRP